ncbi:glycosyltransferase [Mycobacterium sp. PS03-16]|uniref:glycosyltransferase n=1 Tax=Mycobacterium sp. PS03-16 TaxID=2559611 RepID=UPI001072EE64|nr:glycosyltransferase [Mycobacterium sp. PS03-16]TFV60687.1 glycosyltransferase [Mycobacterium sp. PS03-16]
MAGRTIEVIIPVRNMAEHMPKVLRPLMAQLAVGDRVTVINDASTDDTESVARSFGVTVLNLAESRGPYYARQIAAVRSTADILLFIDARSRPLPGLLEAHRALHADPGVALSCTNVNTLSGPTTAARMAAMAQTFSLPAKVGVPGKPPYYPTANLGVDRQAFHAVGGFRAMRSGGDADICWRVQENGLGRMGIDDRVLMEWEPRQTMPELASQFKRYGRGTAYLQWAYRQSRRQGGGRAVAHRPTPAWFKTMVLNELRRPVRQHLARAVINYWLQVGYISERFKQSQFTMPVRYDLSADAEIGGPQR